MSILNWLSGGEAQRGSAICSDPRVRQAVEIAVVGIDANLRLAKDYECRLQPAIERALEHCAAIAAAIPGPMVLAPEAWSVDAGLRALFAQIDDIEKLLGRSLELLTYAEQAAHAGVDDLWAVISMTRTERKVLGWGSQGSLLQREVPQRTVSFARHRLLVPSTNEAELRSEVQWRSYEHLVVEALGNLLRAGTPGSGNSRVDALLYQRLELLQRARGGLDAWHQPPVTDETAYRGTRRELIDNGRELAALQRHASMPDERLDRVIEILSKPEEFITVEPIEDRLTALNVVARNESETAVDLQLALISTKGARSFTRAAAMVRVRRSELRPRPVDYADAERWL